MIYSTKNERVKRLVRLRRRPHRDALRLMLVEGLRPLQRARECGYALGELYHCPALYEDAASAALVEDWARSGIPVLECTEEVFGKIAYGDRPSGVLGVGPFLARTLEHLPLSGNPLLLLAEGIEKPGNLGTMLRTADAVGVEGVLLCDACTDLHNPNVVRASQGALFTVPVVEASSAEAAQALRRAGIRLVAASPDADAVYTETDLRGPAAILVGTEDVGLSAFWMGESDVRVRIPMRGHCDSLNVSTSAALLLYEALRQRHTPAHGN